MKVKRKTTAALAVVIVPLLVLGGGVIVASARRTPKSTTIPGKPSARIASFLAEAKPSPVEIATEPQKTPVDRAQIRAQIIASLERLRYVGRRSAECKELWPEAATEEEGRALQREKVALDTESQELDARLRELAAQDPATIVDLVLNARELPERLRLMGLIAPDIDAELTSQDAPVGPLLSRLLSMASGDSEDRAHLAAFAGQLGRANLALGRTLVQLVIDSDLEVRIHAAHALAKFAGSEAMREFLTDQIPSLKLAALRNETANDCHVRKYALRTLALLGVDEADQFILQQFETLETRNDYGRIEAVRYAARRIAVRYEARLVLAVLRAYDLSFQGDFHYDLRGLASYLSEKHRATVLALADSRRPPPQSRSMTNWIPIYSLGTASRNMTRVTPFTEERPAYPVVIWPRPPDQD